MLVMLVVSVSVLMGEPLVLVFVLVALCQVQEDAQRHERTGHEQPRRDGFVEHENREDSAEERGEGEIRSGSCRAEVAQGEDEQHETHTVADESYHSREGQRGRTGSTRSS